jgi:hypothetical protein
MPAVIGEISGAGILHEAHVMSWIASTEPLTRYLAALLDAHGVVVDLY